MPLDLEQQPTAQTKSVPAPPRVLVVDDDDLLRKTTRRLLQGAGHEVVEAADADAALAALRAGGFDAVVSDVRMPGLSGIDLLREVRRFDLDLPVILMTGAPDVETAAAAVELGAFRYLQKPFDAALLVAAVDRAVGLLRLAHVRRLALELAGKNAGVAADRAGLEARFQSALTQLWMAFQPIVSASRGRPAAYEALLRTDEEALKSPVAFVDAAERLGRLPELGRAVRAAVAAAVDSAPDGIDVFVNLHPADLLDPELCDPQAPLSRCASRIVLELTERASLDSIADVGGVITRLRALGFRVAIDDLGAGYAGLSCLAALAPDVVKLDMSLVRGIDADGKRQRVVKSMLDLCRSLAMDVVVEGVETAAEQRTLRDLGGELLQGYFYARPARGFLPLQLPPG